MLQSDSVTHIYARSCLGCFTGLDSCKESEFYCDGICKDIKIRCDTQPDCHDGLDELDCPEGIPFLYPIGEPPRGKTNNVVFEQV